MDVSISTIKDWYTDSSRASSKWREEAKLCHQFFSGDQWSEEDKSAMNDSKRPIVTFNRVGPVIDSVSGTEINNRHEIRYVPREVGDAGATEVLNGGVKYLRDECYAEDEESEMFVDMLIAGMGWTETRLDYEVEPEGKIIVNRVDPAEMYWDCSCTRRNLEDSRYRMRVRTDISRGDAEAMFPDIEADKLNASWVDSTTSGDIHHTPRPSERYNNDDDSKVSGDDCDDKKVTIVDVQWFERVSYHRTKDPVTGEMADLTTDEYNIANERFMSLTGAELESVTMTRRVYHQAFVGKEILSQRIMDEGEFTFKCVTGKRDRENKCFYGLVRPMLDPQRWANKFFSQVLFIINSNAKGGLLAEATAFRNPNSVKQEWADVGSVTLLNEGGLAKVREKTAVTYPAGLDKLMEFSIASIRDVTGINMEMLGLADRQQAGVLEVQRKKAAVTILSPLFDSLRRYRKEQGRLMLFYVKNFLNDGRLVRITGKDGEQFVPLALQSDKYDIVVDESPTSPNQKDMVWGVIQQMLPMVKDSMSPDMWAELIRFSPLPSGLSQKFAALIGQQAQQPNPMQEAALAEKQSKIEQNKAGASLTGAQAIQQQMQNAMGASMPMQPQGEQQNG